MRCGGNSGSLVGSRIKSQGEFAREVFAGFQPTLLAGLQENAQRDFTFVLVKKLEI